MIDSLGGAAAIAAIATCAIHLPAIRYGLEIGDEGYLWYGTLQVLGGKIPIRDFRAYDPARYYWCALWCLLFGRRNLSIRAAMTAIQFAGLWLAVIFVHAVTRNWAAAALWSVPLCACMRPWFRQFECTSSIAAVCAGVLMLMHPAPAHYFGAGLWAGLGVLVGLNLAVYNATGLLLVILSTRGALAAPSLLISCGWYLLGVAAAVVVLLLVFAAIPRFLITYWRMKIDPLITRGSTNLPLPIPWLWRRHTGAWTPSAVALRSFFTALPLFYAASFGWLLLGSHEPSLRSTLFAASICVGAPYAHQAFSRADAVHAFGAMPPVLLALSVFLFSSTLGMIVVIVIVAATAWAVGTAEEHPIARLRNPNGFSRFSTERDTFWVGTTWAAALEGLRVAVDAHSARAEPVLFAPFLVTLYPLFDRTPAVYDIYCVYPATETTQRQMIASMVAARVRLAIVWNFDLDGREDLRFSNTHPLVWRHLEASFESRPVDGMFADVRCFAR